MAAALCQRSEAEIRERLTAMEGLGYIERGGTKRDAYWCINPALYTRMADDGRAKKRRRIDWEATKTRVLPFHGHLQPGGQIVVSTGKRRRPVCSAF
ncbi:MAG: hypothetical protein EA420_14165 [Candidatus Competibacteraceae bacterium]|nr:MAG: hypothetical protein EA420_14165 [Candidatus Competibacteraceae bacterium]